MARPLDHPPQHITPSPQDWCGGKGGHINMEMHLVSHADDHQGTRRDFIYYATAGAGAVATGAAVWPLVNSMNPSKDVLALASFRRDLSDLQEGMQIVVLWQGKPVFVRFRTPDEIAAAQDVDVDSLPDPLANSDNLGDEAAATDENRTVSVFDGGEGFEPTFPPGALYVSSGLCTHLGCVPVGESGDFGGWFCPCHGSHYDTAGRIRRGPAPRNLPIPYAVLVEDTVIQLGEEA